MAHWPIFHSAAKRTKPSDDNQPAIKKEEAEPEPQGFVPSEVWAKENRMRPFVPQLMEAAQKAADGHALNSHACAAHRGVPDGSAWGVMSHFFDGTGDTYDNAVDKPAWVKETCSGSHDWRAPLTNKESPADVGSMCPVEHGGSLRVNFNNS